MDRPNPVPQKVFRKICRDMETVEQREAKEGDRTMEDRYYVVTILSGPENDPDDMFNPECYPETYGEAVSIARPWAEQGYEVVITTKKYKEE